MYKTRNNIVKNAADVHIMPKMGMNCPLDLRAHLNCWVGAEIRHRVDALPAFLVVLVTQSIITNVLTISHAALSALEHGIKDHKSDGSDDTSKYRHISIS